MTGIYGAGRAFNLKYRPNGPMKIFVNDRRPIFNFFGGCRGAHYGGYDYMSSSTYVEYKPNFWDNLSSIIQSGVSAFCMLGSMGVFNKKADGVEGKPKPQGATSGDVDHFKNLKNLVKSRNIDVIDEGDDKFTLVDPKTGKNIKNATYEEAQDWYFDLIKTNSNKPAAEPSETAPAATEPAAEDNNEINANSTLTATQARNLATGTKITFIDEAKQLANGEHNYKSDVDGEIIKVGDKSSTSKDFPATMTINTKFGPKEVTFDGIETNNEYTGEKDATYKTSSGEIYRLRADENGDIIFVQHESDINFGAKKPGNPIFRNE